MYFSLGIAYREAVFSQGTLGIKAAMAGTPYA
jgi:hypothetical protein